MLTEQHSTERIDVFSVPNFHPGANNLQEPSTLEDLGYGTGPDSN